MKESFENQWRSALEKAEIQPPADSWRHVEEALDKKKKRRGVFFWWNNTAKIASMVAAVLLVLGIVFFNFKDKNNNKIAEINQGNDASQISGNREMNKSIQSQKKTVPENLNIDNQLINDKTTTKKKSNISKLAVKKDINLRFLDKQIIKNNTANPYAANNVIEVKETLENHSEDTKTKNDLGLELSRKNNVESSSEPIELKYLNPIRFAKLYISKLPFMPYLEVNEPINEVKKTKEKNNWISLASGVSPFSPNYNFGNNDASLALVNTDPAQFSAKSFQTNTVLDVAEIASAGGSVNQFEAGKTINIGLAYGKTIKKNWAIESGFRYSQSSVNNVSNVYTLDPKNGRVYSFFQSAYVNNANAGQQSLNSFLSDNRQTYNYLSVPIKLIYSIPIWKKISAETNLGFSNDIFLNAKFKGDATETYSVNATNSKYRFYNTSGVVGLGLNYKISSNWQANVNSNYQRALFSGSRGSLDFKPSMFGLNYGFRYNFKK